MVNGTRSSTDDVLEEILVKFANEADYPVATEFEIEQKRKGRIHAFDELLRKGSISHEAKFLMFAPGLYLMSQWGQKDLAVLEKALPIISGMFEAAPEAMHTADDLQKRLKANGFLFLESVDVQRLLRVMYWLSLLGGYRETQTEPKVIEAFAISRLILRCDDLQKHVVNYYPPKPSAVSSGTIGPEHSALSAVEAPPRPRTFRTAFATYEVLKTIGQGATGTVFEVRDEDGTSFALKLLDPAKATRDRVKRFRNEITFCRANKHANIVTVLDEGLAETEKASSLFYVMPRVPGSLREAMASGLNQDEVLSVFAQLLNGVEAAHLQKVVHRDLKPENVLYDRQAKRIMVADFGIARFEEEELYTAVETRNNERLANFQYAAPEQRARGANVDERADLFALGLMLNEMFTGVVPGGTGYKKIAEASRELGYLDQIVDRMIRQKPDERPSSIEEVRLELSRKAKEFLSSQKLSVLSGTVVPTTDVDDPLASDPPRLIDADYSGGHLILKLSRPVNPKWISALHNMGTYECVSNKEPERFNISGDIASIAAGDREVQPIIDCFKKWLDTMSRMYPRFLESELRQEEERKMNALAAQVAEEERRQRILKNIRI